MPKPNNHLRGGDLLAKLKHKLSHSKKALLQHPTIQSHSKKTSSSSSISHPHPARSHSTDSTSRSHPHPTNSNFTHSHSTQSPSQVFSTKLFTKSFSSNSLTIPLIILALGITLTGYNLIKTIKSPNSQSASAEQLPGTPESGAKSRITELYDALVAQNKGSDTDISNLPAAQGDWGAKWNRIKTAALRSGGGGGNNSSNSGCGAYNPNDPEVNFTDPFNCKQWSYPLSVKNNNQVTAAINNNITNWSWDASGPNNRAVGNKTAAQLCQALGNNWRLPAIEELLMYSMPSGVSDRSYVMYKLAQGRNSVRWSLTEHWSNHQRALGARWDSEYFNDISKESWNLVSCIREY